MHWHCWLGHLTCKNPSPIWPICVWWDVKPCSINHGLENVKWSTSQCYLCIKWRWWLGTFSDSISSADGIHTQRPLEQRSNARGALSSGRSSGRTDRPARGRGHAHDTPSNDRLKPSPQQPASAPSPLSNDVTVQSPSAAKPTTVSTGKEAGDGVKSASEKQQPHSQSKPVTEPSVNNTKTSGTEPTPNSGAAAPAGDWHRRRGVNASIVSKIILKI